MNDPSYRLPGRTIVLTTYTASILVVCVLAVLLASRVSPLALGLGLAATLLLVGALAITLLHKADSRRPRWKDVMPCYFSVQNRDLRITETNQLFRRDFGDRKGEYCYRVYKDADGPCANCPVLATFHDGKIHTGEETVITRNGTTANVVVTSAPHYDHDGKLVGVVEMSTNITEIRALERELERTRLEYQRLFDLVPCYISVQDRNYEIIECNELVRRDFGEALGRRCYCVYKNRDELCTNCIVARSFADGKVYSSEERTRTKDGTYVDLITYSMPIRDGDGEISRVMEVATDITEVKELQQQLTMIGRAVAGLAHRIKNILMGLEGGLFVVNTAFAKQDQQAITQGWEMIERNVERVSHIVKDLLYCSKEREPVFESDVAAEQIARDVHDLFRERAAKDDIDLCLEVAEPQARTLVPDGIHSLIANLVTNAIDACRFDPDETKQRHQITIRCRTSEAGETRIEIQDSGAGIPKELSDKVFEDFFSTKGTAGTGLGLLIISRVVAEHSGSISFTSEPGQGTTFTVTIPPLTAGGIPAGTRTDS